MNVRVFIARAVHDTLLQRALFRRSATLVLDLVGFLENAPVGVNRKLWSPKLIMCSASARAWILRLSANDLIT